MDATHLVDRVEERLHVDFWAGVPDSLLRPLCDELIERYGLSSRHVVAADEGGAVALASGHFLSTGHPGAVYMQNSGIGNAINPICSLIDKRVYAIPTLFIVGWRGEPGVHDEPQHVFQGMVSEDLLKCVGLEVMVFSDTTDETELDEFFARTLDRFSRGESSAILVKNGALTRSVKHAYKSYEDATLTRERAVDLITSALPKDTAVVSTTGKLSRELFELREARLESHASDFLTVGSMGHSAMIGLGVALGQPWRKTVVLDGDGAVIMHTGALAIIGQKQPSNFVHVVINNGAHETVGGMPNASGIIDYAALAMSMGYRKAFSAKDEDELTVVIPRVLAAEGPVLLEVRTALGARSNLGRPTTRAYSNGREFMDFLIERVL